MTAEKDIRAKIVDYLEATYPGSEWSISTPNSPTANPDIYGCIPRRFQYEIMPIVGVYVGIEVKVPGKKPRPAQSYKLKRLKKAGAVMFAATSVAEVEAYLKSLLPGHCCPVTI